MSLPRYQRQTRARGPRRRLFLRRIVHEPAVPGPFPERWKGRRPGGHMLQYSRHTCSQSGTRLGFVPRVGCCPWLVDFNPIFSVSTHIRLFTPFTARPSDTNRVLTHTTVLLLSAVLPPAPAASSAGHDTRQVLPARSKWLQKCP